MLQQVLRRCLGPLNACATSGRSPTYVLHPSSMLFQLDRHQQVAALHCSTLQHQQQHEGAAEASVREPQLSVEELQAIRLRVFGEPEQQRTRSGRRSRSSSGSSSPLKSLHGREIADWYLTLRPPLPMQESDLETKRLAKVAADKVSGRAPPKKGSSTRRKR